MNQGSFDLQYRVEHRHADGSWSEMVEERRPHDAADHDSERSWGLRRIFRCPKCNERVTLEPGPGDDDEAAAG
jgi:hypothetical protein